MTKKLPAAAAALALGFIGAAGLAALPTTVSAQPLTPAGEAAAHPHIVHAIRVMEAAYAELAAAPDDFGGNKAQAMMQTRNAIHSLRRALFYRLQMDDAAIDAWRF